MGFKIDNNTIGKKVTLEQLTAGLDQVKDKKKIDRITQIFNKYNTNTQKNSADALDMDEQIALMNDLHKADGDGKAEDFDSKVSKRGLKKAGFAGEYKAYRDFIEAYQKAVGDTQNTYDLNFKDGTLEGQQYIETTAKRSGTVDGQEYTEQHQYIDNQKAKSTYQNADRTISYSPKGQLLQQTVDGTTIKYRQYDSDAKNAKPGVITVRQGDSVMTVKLKEDGTYLNSADNSHYRLNQKGLLDEFTVDDKNRVTSEVWGENLFDYAYEGDNTKPSEITLNKGTQTEKQYILDGELYTSQNGENKEYFTFDSEKREFTQTEAPQPIKPAVQKQTRPTQRHFIKMTEGWKNQKVKPNKETTAKFNAMSTANEVLAELIKDKDGINQETLLVDLIRNNPSVFNDKGVIYSDARWNRLDFPKDLSRYKTAD